MFPILLTLVNVTVCVVSLQKIGFAPTCICEDIREQLERHERWRAHRENRRAMRQILNEEPEADPEIPRQEAVPNIERWGERWHPNREYRRAMRQILNEEPEADPEIPRREAVTAFTHIQ